MLMKTNVRSRRFYPTSRDLDLVRYTWDAGLATREQLQLLFFSQRNRSRAQTRIGLLAAHGYLHRLPGRFPNEPAVYTVTKRGELVLGLIVSATPHRSISMGRLAHTIAIGDCRVRITLACRETGVHLVRWLAEDELRPITVGSGILPDAAFQIERETDNGPRHSGFFLEVERTEKGERALRDKLLALGSYYYGGGYERDFRSKALRVLVLVQPEPGLRGDRLVRKVVEMAARLGVTLVRVAELERFLSMDPGELLTAPFWRQPGVDKLVGLLPAGGVDA